MLIYIVSKTFIVLWLAGEVLSVEGKETDFRKPAAIREKLTGVATGGFDCNYSLLDVDKTLDSNPSLRLCGV